MFFLFYTRM